MADISFDGIQIDAEKVREALAEHDRKKTSLVGHTFNSPHTCSRAEVVVDDQHRSTRSVQIETNGGCPWYRSDDLRCYAAWIRELADKIE